MKLLLDTQLLLWTAGASANLSPDARALIESPGNDLFFSVVSVWEVAIKAGLRRPDFRADPQRLRTGLLDNGYREITISGEHAVAVSALPPLHKDPFDRLLVAQAREEGLTLVTTDRMLASYPGQIRRV